MTEVFNQDLYQSMLSSLPVNHFGRKCLRATFGSKTGGDWLLLANPLADNKNYFSNDEWRAAASLRLFADVFDPTLAKKLCGGCSAYICDAKGIHCLKSARNLKL